MDVKIGVISSYVDKGIKAAIADLKRYLAQLAEAQKKASSFGAGGVGGIRGVSDDFAKLNPEFAEYLNSLGKADVKTKTFWQQMGILRSHIVTVTVVLGSLALAIKGVWETFKRGAEVQQTADSFNYLIQKTGQSRDYLEQLRVASRGTISDLELMGDTLTIVAGTTEELQDKLLKATPELLEIAKAASKLNPTLGDTSYMFESITQGIKRQERRILDNLGIIVRLREANQRYADSMGIAKEAMTAEDTQQAFLNEALRVGRLLVEQAGNSTASAVDPYNRLTAAATNLYNIEAKRLQQSGLIGWLADIAQYNNLRAMAVEAVTEAEKAGLLVDGQKEKILLNLKNGMADSIVLLEYINELEAQRIALTIQYNQASESKLGTINAEGSIVSTLINKYAGLGIEELKIAAASEKVTAANLALNTATQEGADNLAELTLVAAQAEDALYQLQGGALAAARAQSILNAQLAGARAGFGGQFAGLVDGYTAKIAALNDQLAKAGGGGGGKPEKPVDMEEARLREAVAAGDLRDAYGDLNEIEGKITEQEKMLAEARESGADPAWIEYLEGSIQHLKDEQARAKLAIYEKQKALTELQNILNGVAEAEDNYAASSGGAASAAINLKDEIAKLNEELDKEIKKMVVMAAVQEILASDMPGAAKAALDMGKAFGLIDAASAAAIEGAILIGKGVAEGVIAPDAGTQMLNNIFGILDELAPRIEQEKGKIVEIWPDEKKKEELQDRLEDIITFTQEKFKDMGADADDTKEQIDGMANSIGGEKAKAGSNIPTLPEATLNAQDAIKALGVVFNEESRELSGLSNYYVGIENLNARLETLLQRIRDAQALLSGAGGTPPPTGTPTPPGGATGLDMIVPPGYPNDSFPIRVQSGEHVKVTPASQVGMTTGYRGGRKGRGNSSINVNGTLNISLEGVQDADALLESLRDALGVA